MIKGLFCLLLVFNLTEGFSQTFGIADTPVVLYNDIYNNFKTYRQTYHYSGTFALDSAGNLVNTSVRRLPAVPLNYMLLTNKADSLFYQKQYLHASHFYLIAIKVNDDQDQLIYRYRTAICLSSVADTDGAFTQLFWIAEKGKYYNYKEIENEITFAVLHKDPRWPILIELIKNNARKWEEKLNTETHLEPKANEQKEPIE